MGTNQGTAAGVVIRGGFAARPRLRPGGLESFHGPAFPFLAPVAQRFTNNFAGVAILAGRDLLRDKFFPVFGERHVHRSKIECRPKMSIDSTLPPHLIPTLSMGLPRCRPGPQAGMKGPIVLTPRAAVGSRSSDRANDFFGW